MTCRLLSVNAPTLYHKPHPPVRSVLDNKYLLNHAGPEPVELVVRFGDIV